MSCGGVPCSHPSCTSAKLHALKYCHYCSSSIHSDFRSIVCNFCNIISCINCYSSRRNSSINPNHIIISQTNDSITCNSCLLTLNKGSSKSFGIIQKTNHVLCDKCVRKIKSWTRNATAFQARSAGPSFNSAVNYDDLLQLKNDLQQKLQVEILQQHKTIQTNKQNFSDRFDDLHSTSHQQYLQINRLSSNFYNISTLFNQYKDFVDKLLLFQSTYQPLFDQFFQQSSQLNASVQFLLTSSAQRSPQIEDGEIANPSQFDTKLKLLQLQCNNQNHNIQNQINQQNFHIDKKIQQFSDNFNQQLNDLFHSLNPNFNNSPDILKRKKQKHL